MEEGSTGGTNQIFNQDHMEQDVSQVIPLIRTTPDNDSKPNPHYSEEVMRRKAYMLTQLSRISERTEQDGLVDDNIPFDVNEILMHLSTFGVECEDPTNTDVYHEETKEVVNEETEINDHDDEEEKEDDNVSDNDQRTRKSQHRRRYSDGQISFGRRKRSRISLPNIRFNSLREKKDSNLSLLNETVNEKFDKLSGEWKDVFNSLDRKDGHKDGRLHKKSLQNIMNTLETNSTWSLQYRSGKLNERIQRQISRADQDKSGYINKDEFADLVTKLNVPEDLNEAQLNHVMTEYIKTAAYAEEFRLCPPPFFIIITTILQLGFFIYHVHHLDTCHGQTVLWDSPAPLCSNLIYNPAVRWQPWRYLSYSMVHSGYSHVVVNLVMQMGVGLPLECSQGTIRVSLVYMMGVLAGSLATSCLDPQVYLAGASGGIYSLILAHLSALILNWHEDVLIVRPKVLRKRGQDKVAKATHGTLIRMLKLTAVMAFTIVDTSMAVYHKHMNWNTTTGYTAHIAGAVAGLVFGFFALKNRRVQQWEIKLKVASFVLTMTLLGGGVLWNIFGDLWYGHMYPGKTYFLPSATTTKTDICLYYKSEQ